MPVGIHFALGIIPDIPFVAAGDAAFVAEDEAHAIEELIHVELKRLGETEGAAVEVNIISEIVIGIHLVVIVIRHALGRLGTDEVVVPDGIAVIGGSAEVVFRSFSSSSKAM